MIAVNFFTGTFVGLDGAIIGPADPVPCNVAKTNLGQHWNKATNSFQTSASSLYYVSMAAGSLANRPVDYVLTRNNEPVIRIMRGSTTHTGMIDTTSRDMILDIRQGQELRLVSRGNSSGLGGEMGHLETSLCVFDLRHAMAAPLIAFSVGLGQPLSQPSDTFPFNYVLVNEEGYYNNLNNIFTATTGGYYFFHLSVGAVGGKTVDLTIKRNNLPFMDVFRNSTAHNDVDTLGKSILVELNAGDTMFVSSGDNQLTWSSNLLETSFSGFKYDPEEAEVSHP